MSVVDDACYVRWIIADAVANLAFRPGHPGLMHPLDCPVAEAVNMAAEAEAFDWRGVHQRFNWHNGNRRWLGWITSRRGRRGCGAPGSIGDGQADQLVACDG